MDLKPTILGESVCQFQGIKLNICISMRQSLDHSTNDILWPRVFSVGFVTDVQYVLPILRGEVLVRCFRWAELACWR